MQGLLVLLVIAMLWVAAPAGAQQTPAPETDAPRPRRSSSRAFSEDTRHQLSLAGSMLGGYDDNLNVANGDPLTSRASGALAFVDTALSYSSNPTSSRAIEAAARGYINSYPTTSVDTLYGGTESLQARTNIGRRTFVSFREAISYVPLFTLGVVGNDATAANLTDGLAKNASWIMSMAGSFSRRLSRAITTSVDYGLDRQTFIQGNAFDTSNRSLSLAMDYGLSRRWGLRGSYRRGDTTFNQADGSNVDLADHTAGLGFSYRRRLTPTRTLTLAAGGGGIRATTIDVNRRPLTFSAPSGYADLSVGLTRSWSLSGSFRRSVSAPQGVGAEAYVTNNASVGAGGPLNNWLTLNLSGGYLDGTSGSQLGQYRSFSTTIQTGIRFSRRWSVVVSGSHYRYRLNEATSQTLQISPHMDRNSLRIGASWELPIIQSYSTRRRRS